MFESEFGIILFAIEGGLLIIPVICLVNVSKKFLTDNGIYNLIIFTGLLAILRIFNYTIYGEVFDYILPLSAYFIYNYYYFKILNIPDKLIKFILLFVFSIPIVIGYISSTIGFLFLMLVLSDLDTDKNVHIDNKFVYRTFLYGNITVAESGTKLEVYELLLGLPIIEHLVYSKDINRKEFEDENLKVKLIESNKQLQIQIYSNDSLQIDEVISK